MKIDKTPIRQLAKFRANCWTSKLYKGIDNWLAALEVSKINTNLEMEARRKS
jgi:hypothetical protein